MTTSTTKLIWICTVCLGLVYVGLMPFASNVYGYMGYNGYYAGPSFWYFGGPVFSHERSIRNGSVNGTHRMGGGPGSGK